MIRDYLDPQWWIDTPIAAVHLVGALIALVLGPVTLLRRKGDRRHRVTGYSYVVIMASVNVSALLMYDLTGRPNLFHFFAVMSLVTITPGVILAIRARRTGRRDLLVGHYYFMSWSYFGLLAAFLSQIGTRLGPLPGGLSPFVAVGIGTFLMAGVATLLINRSAGPVTQRYGAKS